MSRLRERRRSTIVAASAVCIAVLGVAIVVLTGPDRRLATRVPMIDVQSARVFWVSVSARAVSVPAPHPETGSRTLVGIDREPDGSWRVLPHDLPLVASLGVRVSPRIDASTGIVAPDREANR